MPRMFYSFMVVNSTCRERYLTHGNVLIVKNMFRVDNFGNRTYAKLIGYAKNAIRNAMKGAVGVNRYFIVARIAKRRTGQDTKGKTTVQSTVLVVCESFMFFW